MISLEETGGTRVRMLQIANVDTDVDIVAVDLCFYDWHLGCSYMEWLLIFVVPHTEAVRSQSIAQLTEYQVRFPVSSSCLKTFCAFILRSDVFHTGHLLDPKAEVEISGIRSKRIGRASKLWDADNLETKMSNLNNV